MPPFARRARGGPGGAGLCNRHFTTGCDVPSASRRRRARLRERKLLCVSLLVATRIQADTRVPGKLSALPRTSPKSTDSSCGHWLGFSTKTVGAQSLLDPSGLGVSAPYRSRARACRFESGLPVRALVPKTIESVVIAERRFHVIMEPGVRRLD